MQGVVGDGAAVQHAISLLLDGGDGGSEWRCTQLKIRRLLITSSANIRREWLIAAAAAADQCNAMQCNDVLSPSPSSSFFYCC